MTKRKAMDMLKVAWIHVTGSALSEILGAQLVAAYKKPHRYYHNQQHINDFSEKIDRYGYLFQRVHEAVIACWFHDAWYDPRRIDNEEKSAQWAKMELLDSGAPHDAIERIVSIIMSTKSHAASENLDQNLFIDIDLSIFASTIGKFRRYEQQIRQEYAFLDDHVFLRERKRILLEFLVKPNIYNHSAFQNLWERKARTNLVALCL